MDQPPQPEIRIGDRERREVDARLQQAQADGMLTLLEYDERAAACWAARTRSELDALTSDLPQSDQAETTVLPVDPPAPGPAEAPPAGLARRVVGGVVTAALVGTGLYLGAQVITADDGVSVFGSGVVQVGADQQRVEVGMLFGSIRVVVPDDVRVRPSGTVIFGSTRCEEACRPGPGLREVVVDADGGFGSVNIMRQSELDRGEFGDRDRNSDRDDDSDDDD
ncbi:DUF1707 SHOCT-like domain-containing protein [Pseudonocardia xinjiangensis]|uniref:DUF1707 SHOCT-like domain-containing protein n=1 Tax=Pseudonocardia xinjiangensis TaxID=75289 RepID=UPI003D8F0A2C